MCWARHNDTRIYYFTVKSQSDPSLATKPEKSRDLARVSLGVELLYKYKHCFTVKSQSDPSLVPKPERSRDISRVSLGVELSYEILLIYGIFLKGDIMHGI